MPVVRYRWDDLTDNIHQEVDENGSVDVQYTQKPELYGHVISQRRGTTKSFYHFDAQGSTRKLTNINHVNLGTYTYSAFGQELAVTGSAANSYRFGGSKGYYFDNELNKCYVRRRIYRSDIGLWTSADPIRSFLVVASYLYCRNNPTKRIDPTGLLEIDLKNKNWPERCNRYHCVHHAASSGKGLVGLCVWIFEIKLYCLLGGCDNCDDCEEEKEGSKDTPALIYLEAAAARMKDDDVTAKAQHHKFTLVPHRLQCGFQKWTAKAQLVCGTGEGEDYLGRILKWGKKEIAKCGYTEIENGPNTLVRTQEQVDRFWETIKKVAEVIDGPEEIEFTMDFECCFGGNQKVELAVNPDDKSAGAGGLCPG